MREGPQGALTPVTLPALTPTERHPLGRGDILERMIACEVRAQDFEGRVQVNEDAILDHEARIGSLETKVQDHENRITVLEGHVTQYGQTQSANPPVTASQTYVMMGIGILSTTARETAVWVTSDGQISNTANNGHTDVVICFGSGSLPAFGTAQSGTIVTAPASYVSTAANDYVPYSITGIADNMTVGVDYWFDLAMRAPNGTAKIFDVNITAHGM